LKKRGQRGKNATAISLGDIPKQRPFMKGKYDIEERKREDQGKSEESGNPEGVRLSALRFVTERNTNQSKRHAGDTEENFATEGGLPRRQGDAHHLCGENDRFQS